MPSGLESDSTIRSAGPRNSSNSPARGLQRRTKWTEQDKSEPDKRRYRKRMLEEWNKVGGFNLSEKKLAGQLRHLRQLEQYRDEISVE